MTKASPVTLSSIESVRPFGPKTRVSTRLPKLF
jgi:hypothetical protein